MIQTARDFSNPIFPFLFFSFTRPSARAKIAEAEFNFCPAPQPY